MCGRAVVEVGVCAVMIRKGDKGAEEVKENKKEVGECDTRRDKDNKKETVQEKSSSREKGRKEGRSNNNQASQCKQESNK